MIWLCVYFFFQAEDGIRDRNVTGVQTCALPISKRDSRIAMAPWRSCCRASCRSSAPARPSSPGSGACPTGASSSTTSREDLRGCCCSCGAGTSSATSRSSSRTSASSRSPSLPHRSCRSPSLCAGARHPEPDSTASAERDERADDRPDEQCHVGKGAQHESEMTALRRVHVAPEVEHPSDEKHRPESGRNVRVDVAG